jgi:hypothetical protein
VQVPLTQESDALQQGTLGEHDPFVAPQTAGATQVAGAGPAPSGSMHESLPLQQGSPGGEQVEPVLAQTAGAVQTGSVPLQVSAGLQQLAAVVHEEPVPAHVAATVQTLLPGAPAQAPANGLQQSASTAQAEPVPAHAAAGSQRFPLQTSVAVQQGWLAQERPVAAQVGGATHVPDEHTSVPQQASVAQEAPCAAHVGA